MWYMDITPEEKQALLNEKTMQCARTQMERIESIIESPEHYPSDKKKAHELYLLRSGIHAVLSAIARGDNGNYEWIMSDLTNADMKHYGK